MKKLQGQWLFALIAVLLSACGGRQSSPQAGGDTLQLKYASLLTIVQHDGYTEAVIRNPWKEGRVLHSYLLVPRGQELPDGMPHGSIVRTPVQHAAVFTTVHCSLLTTLGLGERIAAVADLKYIKIPYVQQRVRDGHIADCGGGMNPTVERIIDVKPDIIMLSPFENSGGYGKLEDIDIPLVECAEYMEPSPLARAEWMKFYGLLFGEYDKADSLFQVVDQHYQTLKAQAAKAGKGREALIDKMVGSVWYVPGGRSTLGQMVRDANGRYPWAADDHSGSLSLPFETVLEQGGEADVWFYRYSSDHPTNYRELLSEHRGYDQLKACRQRQVYACNVEQTLFYEETPFRPDYLLSDFILLLHPDLQSDASLRYFTLLDE